MAAERVGAETAGRRREVSSRKQPLKQSQALSQRRYHDASGASVAHRLQSAIRSLLDAAVLPQQQ